VITFRRAPVSIVVIDSGPLIGLAAIDRLDLLDCFSRPLYVTDVVQAECLRFPDKLGAGRLGQWFATFDGERYSIVVTPFLALWKKAVDEESAGALDRPSKGIGDASIAWLLHMFRSQHKEPLLILTEDAGLGDGLILELSPQHHLLSTRMFLQTLENYGRLASATEALQAIAHAGRTLSRYGVDRPGRLDARTKTDWTDTLRTGDHKD
jgi:hypothetical protein